MEQQSTNQMAEYIENFAQYLQEVNEKYFNDSEFLNSLTQNQKDTIIKSFDKMLSANTKVKYKLSKPKEKVIYTHSCFGSSNYHMRKYKHYAKVLKGIDDSKTNGYAFLGEFISCTKENLVDEGSLVIEACSESLYLYRAGKEDDELLLKGNSRHMVSFIQECKKIFDDSLKSNVIEEVV